MSWLFRILYTTSILLPVFALAIIKLLPSITQPLTTDIWISITLLSISVTATAAVVLLLRKGGVVEGLQIHDVQRSDRDIFAIIIAYAPVALGFSFDSGNIELSFYAFYALIAYMLFILDCIILNPILSMLGFRFVSFKLENGFQAMLVSRSDLNDEKILKQVYEIIPGKYYYYPGGTT